MANPANDSSGSDPAADAAAGKNDALWYTFQGIGRAYLISRGSPASSDARAAGVHGYSTIEQAQANPNTISALVQLTISQWDEYASLPFGGGTLGVIETVNVTAPHDGKPAQFSTPQNPSTAAAKQDIPGLGALDAGFRQLTKVSMWRSLGWIMLGGAAVGLGVWWYAKSEAEQGVTSLVRGETPHLTAPVLPLALAGTGLYLIWFGVSYWEDVETVWPSDPVKAILQGKGLPARAPDATASSILDSTESANSAASSGGGDSSPATGSAVPKGNPQTQAHSLLSKYGWSTSQFVPLVSLWNQESGWNAKARNPASGAFGIAQALGHGVPGGAASDGTNEYGGNGLTVSQAKEANSGNAYYQIVWGLNYIKDRYGSPAAAWAHEQEFNWY